MVYNDWNLNGSKELLESYLDYRMANITQKTDSGLKRANKKSVEEKPIFCKNEKEDVDFICVLASIAGVAFGIFSAFEWILSI